MKEGKRGVAAEVFKLCRTQNYEINNMRNRIYVAKKQFAVRTLI